MQVGIRGNSLYAIVNDKNWSNAEDKANALGGHLVSIGSQSENDFISYGPFSYEEIGQFNEFWIGLNDLVSRWEWASGEKYEYENWFYPDEPPGNNAVSIRVANTNRYGHDVTPLRGTWRDLPANLPNQYEYVEAGIAEIPLNLSVSTSDKPTEGAGVFTTSITLTAGSESSGNLAEGVEVYWSISGITAEDLDSGALKGSGVISGGKLDIQHSLVKDDDSGESFEVSVYSNSERTQQIGGTKSFVITDQSDTSFVIHGNSLYTIVNDKNWSNAEDKANALGGHLVSIGSQSENDFISYGPFSYEEIGQFNEFWIGLNDLVSRWEWASGEKYEYENWFYPDEPPGNNAVSIRVANTNRYGHDVTPLRGTWRDLPANLPNQYEYVEAGIAEIPLNLSVSTSDKPTEGAGVFTTSITLTAGSESSGNLAEGVEVYWSISGITAEDLESGSLEGSGKITGDKLNLTHSLKIDKDYDENFEIRVYSDPEKRYQVGNSEKMLINEKDTPFHLIGEGGDDRLFWREF